jgi:3-methyladenine DNA glycosylase Tag
MRKYLKANQGLILAEEQSMLKLLALQLVVSCLKYNTVRKKSERKAFNVLQELLQVGKKQCQD